MSIRSSPGDGAQEDEGSPVFDPEWLRRVHPRCLWDGGRRRRGEEFCSEACRFLYEVWATLSSRRHPGEDYVEQRRLAAAGAAGEVIRYDRDLPRGEVPG